MSIFIWLALKLLRRVKHTLLCINATKDPTLQEPLRGF